MVYLRKHYISIKKPQNYRRLSLILYSNMHNTSKLYFIMVVKNLMEFEDRKALKKYSEIYSYEIYNERNISLNKTMKEYYFLHDQLL